MQNMTETWIDVRGPWPCLVQGLKVTELRGCVRSISTDEALNLIKLNLLDQVSK
jgi:hypothetical protein